MRLPATPIPPLPVLSPREAAPRALGAALAVGVLGDLLLFGTPLGLNFPVLVAAMLAALAWLAARTGRPVTLGAALLGALALAFAAASAWRDAPTLVALDVLGVLTALCALVPAVLHGDALAVDRAGPIAYVAGAAATGGRVAFGAPVLVARALEAAPLPTTAAVAGLGTLARGGLLASPVLLVFGALLVSADPTFARLLERAFGWNGGLLAEHVAMTAFVSWGAGGVLFAALLDRRAPRADGVPDVLTAVGLEMRAGLRRIGLGVREVTVALGLIDVLLVGFGVLQLRWLFGGAASLQAAGLTVAEYARRGFFELAAVSMLALPLLLVAHGVVGEGTPSPGSRRAHHAFRAAAGVLVALVLVLLASAADRMRLYVDAYGLTQDRFYASALMTWLGVVFVWAGMTLLRGRAAPFALGTLLSGWAFVLGLHVVNPDARIADVNSARAAAGRPLDAAYLRALGADAAPALA
ncbi:DUF4173 domain-containing protein, partial [Roseisolibacter sp. H3M3-2]|uniref:DUF4153 domain-containing protein n=1 Tax=Roseisolibacter sp. H3M3-2 TaxID=3031323 RepID=UPI0023DA2933